MSNMQDDEFREDDLPEEVEDPDGGGDAPAPKKASLPMMAAIGVGVVAVVGFAGLKVFNTLAPSPSQQSAQVVPLQPQMQQPQPVVPAAVPAPVVPAAVPAPVVPQVDPTTMPAGVGPAVGAPGALATPGTPGAAAAPGAPVVAGSPVGAPVPSPAGAAPAAPGVQGADAGGRTPIAPLGATPAPTAPAGFVPGAGPVNMDAIAALKKSQETQGKQMDEMSARLQRIEARLAELAEGRPVSAAKSQSASGGDASRKAAVRKARLLKAKELAAKRIEERKRKSAETKAKPADKPRATNVVKSSAVMPDVPAPKRSVPALDLPAAPPVVQPAVEAPKKPPQAEEQPTVRVTGLRIQAVIPGRVWIADEGGVARSYSVGDAVRAGVVIRAIDAEKGVVTTSAGLIR